MYVAETMHSVANIAIMRGTHILGTFFDMTAKSNWKRNHYNDLKRALTVIA
ncbi:hypothetical protein GCM10020370_05210 [Paenibacillus hodogayensis]